MGQVYATADIGSNTVHLLIAEVDKLGVQRIDNRSEWVGLGETVALEKRIPKDGEQILIQLLGDFKSASKGLGAKQFYVFATEAVRAAENHKEVLFKIKKETGVEVDVISPRTEAEFGLRGAL